MNLTYSEELQTLLKKKLSRRIRYGISCIFLICALLISLTPFIPSVESYGVIIEPEIMSDDMATFQKTVVPAAIKLTANNVQELKINQKIVFLNWNAMGYIYSLKDTVFKKGSIIVHAIIKPASPLDYDKLTKAKIETPAYIIKSKTTIFNRILSYATRPIKK